MCTVMVVEDNPDLRELYGQAIRLEGHTALGASNGREALDLLRANAERPAVILLDLMMPVMSGWEFLNEKERDPDLTGIPVVVCSAARDQVPQDLRFFRKPLDLTSIAQVVAEYC